MLQAGVLAVRHRMTVQDLVNAPYIFPTLTEILWVCARAFGREGAGNCPGKETIKKRDFSPCGSVKHIRIPVHGR